MRFNLFLLVLLSLALTGCQSKGDGQDASGPGEVNQENVAGETEEVDAFVGIVIETMNAGGYTYVFVDTGEELIWAAGPEIPIEVDEIVVIGKSMAMPNFYSESLGRGFEMIYFVTHFGDEAAAEAYRESLAAELQAPTSHAGISRKSQAADQQTQNPHAGIAGLSEPAQVDLEGIEAAEQTIVAIYENKSSLAGKPVRVRGRVVKAISGVMGRNWLHIQDGTGEQGTNDLTVTSDAMAPVGATVVIEGVLGVDRDFGAGYRYAVMVEEAKVTVE